MISNLQEGDKLYIDKWQLDYIIGIDEAGRGTLAGPVVAAAIALSLDNLVAKIWQQPPLQYTQDSKKVTATRRQAIYDVIQSQYPIGLGLISANRLLK
jgi:ribonuclease HII